MKLNPVYKKELKLSVRGRKLSNIIILYNGILAIFSLLAFYAIFGVDIGYGSVNYESLLTLYASIAVMQIVLVALVVPALTAGSIAGERERQTLDILFTTKLTSGQIIRGKLASSISDLLLVVFSSIPIMAILFSIGGISVMDLAQLIILIVVTSVLAGSIAIFMSAWSKKTLNATIQTYVIILLFGVGYPIFVMLIRHIIAANDWNTDISALGYAFLLNPGFTVSTMVMEQVKSMDTVRTVFEEFAITNNWLIEKWFWLSLIVQLLFSALFLFLAQKVINPIKKAKK